MDARPELNPATIRCIFGALKSIDDKLRFAAVSTRTSAVLFADCQQITGTFATPKTIARAGSVILYKQFCRNHRIPLHNCGEISAIAAKNGHEELVKLLVTSPRANLPPRHNADAALRGACSGGKIGVVRMILDDPRLARGPPCKCVRAAAVNGHTEVLALLLSRGIGPSPGLLTDIRRNPPKNARAIVDLLAPRAVLDEALVDYSRFRFARDAE